MRTPVGTKPQNNIINLKMIHRHVQGNACCTEQLKPQV